ncbi:MAG: Uma2 family endonuclease [Chloroflexi bacterium]|nr:Uma2 family endonuclease [Chloroflexota bacterium]
MMRNFVFSAPLNLPAGTIIATDVDEETYLRDFAGEFHEWVQGVVIQMAPASSRHDALTTYLRMLLEAYLALRPVGTLRSAPFVMRLDESFREPDIQFIAADRTNHLTDIAMNGPADICIEIVSAESVRRDYGDKFEEYERVGVKEYWMIDPLRNEAHFHRLQDDTGRYASIHPDNSLYTTALLPDFQLDSSHLWADTLPDFFAVGEMVRAMILD